MEEKMNLIENARKLLGFRLAVINACKKNNIDAPTDEQISEYVNGYGRNVDDFMADYMGHEGMFRYLRTPLEDFKDEISKIAWGNEPTEEEVITFFNEHGNDIDTFLEQKRVKEMQPIVRKTYLATIDKLNEKELVNLWNAFIEESALYGEDSYIYDLEDEDDVAFLSEHMNHDEANKVFDMAKDGVRFIQWLATNDGTIKKVEDIKKTISAFWEEIFERIMIFPTAYDLDKTFYFCNVFFPVIAKEIGYEIDVSHGTLSQITNS